MSRTVPVLTSIAVAMAFAVGTSLIGTTGALAQKGEPTPKPKVDCSKPENKRKSACKNRTGQLSDDDLFYAGYWLARKGDYQTALHYLNQAANKDDPRFLTYIGFATRKLGDWHTAKTYYDRALAVDANYTIARAYLGEAYLQQGDKAAALRELDEIATRCGVTCDEYKELAEALAKHTAG